MCIFITASSAVTWYLIPDTCDERGESRSLEDLGLGCQGLKNSEDKWERDLSLQQSRAFDKAMNVD